MELFGDDIEVFCPVLRTPDIGNIGTLCCRDGEYPEAVRALAFNGAEVVYRPGEAVRMTTAGSDADGTWLLQNRAHAHFDGLYTVYPSTGPVCSSPAVEHPADIAGGKGHVVACCARVIRQARSGTNAVTAAPVDIEALRRYRLRNLNPNRLKDIRTELFRRLHDRPIHPANLWLDRESGRHAEVDDVCRANTERLVQQRTYAESVHHFPGKRRPGHRRGPWATAMAPTVVAPDCGRKEAR
ncbi:nitrilase-related carbon-nitrogen hydrolase [Streptomyces sp. NPDC056930]|uniref:nitrilase-related carbon-nitrogen hydrolase n=1 Tax=Streptomyces sp. NPDC056930 TaxID=3345967 RepID=UPI00362C303E